MATSSFTKDFKITKKETFKKIEKAYNVTKPLKINSKDAFDKLKRSEEKLLNILRFKD